MRKTPLSEERAISEAVACLRILSKALAAYDRALFHYDKPPLAPSTAAWQNGPDVSLNYSFYFKNLPVKDPQDRTGKKYIAELDVYKVWLLTQVIDIYFQAARALSQRYEYVAGLHKEELEKIGKENPVADRSPDYAANVTQNLTKNYLGLLNTLSEKIKTNADRDYCNYEVEFDTLSEQCLLFIDEIEFLCQRVDELQEFIRDKRNVRNAYIGAALTIVGIFSGAAGSWLSGGDHSPPAHHSDADSAQIAALRTEARANDSLAIEIGKISERTLRLEQTLEKIAAAQTSPKDDANQALLTEIKALREAVTTGNAATVAQLKEALVATEKNLNDAISKIPAPQKKDDPATPAPGNQALMDEIKALKDSISALKTSVESRPPTIIIQDSSKRKHGLFNWF